MNTNETITMNDNELIATLQQRASALRAGKATLESMHELSQAFDAFKTDFVADANAITWNPDNGKMIVPVAPVQDELNALFGVVTDETAVELGYDVLAFRHVAAKLGNLPASYLLDCPNNLRADNLNYWQGEVKDGKQWRVRAFEHDARAVVSDRYHAINNTHVIEIAQSVLQEMRVPYDLIRSYVDANTLHIKLRVADTNDGNYGIGVTIRNGEITNYSLGVFPFLQRHSCTNSIVHQAGGWQQRHVGHTETFLRGAIAEHIGLALKAAPAMLERIVQAQMQELPNLTSVLDDLCKNYGFNAVARDAIAIGTEGENTVMGVVNGVSYAAHALTDENTTIDNRIQMEHLSGDLLMGDFFKVIRRGQGEEPAENDNAPAFAFVR